MAMHVHQQSRRRRGGFPWGLLVLVGVGYVLYKEHQQSTAAPAVTTPGQPALPSPPATTTPVTPAVVTTAMPAQLQQPALSDQALVLQVAQADGRAGFVQFAQSGDPADITLLANIIRNEWQVYGKCHTTACAQNWAYLIHKYNIG